MNLEPTISYNIFNLPYPSYPIRLSNLRVKINLSPYSISLVYDFYSGPFFESSKLDNNLLRCGASICSINSFSSSSSIV